MQVRISKQARADAVAAVTWWQRNQGVPSNLLSELQVARRQLAVSPNAGVSVKSKVSNLRRLALVKSRYFLFYEVDEVAGVVTVLRVWHMSRGQQPKL